MCTVVILRRPGEAWPVVIGANRDERLDPAALDAALDPKRDFAHVDAIFERVFTQA